MATSTIIKKQMMSMYQASIAGTSIACAGVGFYYGNRLAYNSCFIKENLTIPEFIGEVFCYGTIITTNVIMFGSMSGLYVATFPLSFPATYWFYNNILKDTLDTTDNR